MIITPCCRQLFPWAEQFSIQTPSLIFLSPLSALHKAFSLCIFVSWSSSTKSYSGIRKNCNHLVHCQWYPFAPCWTCPQQWGHIVSLLPDPLPRTWLTHWASCQGRSWWRKCFSRLVTWPPSNPIPWLHFRERLKTSRPHFWILTEGVLWDNEIST